MGYDEVSGSEPLDAEPTPDQTATFEEVDALATSKRTTSPAFQFYPKEFLSSTKVIDMSATERGVYITLLCMQWLDGSVPADLAVLARRVNIKPAQFARMWEPNLSQCFVERNGRFINPRLEQVRKEQIEYRKRQAEAGKNGAAKRWASPDDGKPTARLQPDDGSSSATCVPASATRDVLRERFDRFWAVYPKKASKGEAFKAWKAIKPSDDLTDTMIAAVRQQVTSFDWRKDGGKYIPHPATWLRGERWQDEPLQAPQPEPETSVFDRAFAAARERVK